MLKKKGHQQHGRPSTYVGQPNAHSLHHKLFIYFYFFYLLKVEHRTTRGRHTQSNVRQKCTNTQYEAVPEEKKRNFDIHFTGRFV